MHYKERERKSTALFRRISYMWNFPRDAFMPRCFRLELLCLGLVEDDGVVDGGVLLPPRFLELVSARTGDCRVRRCAAAPPLAARLRLSPLRLSGWYCSVDRRTERTHAASHSRPVFDVFNGFPPPDPDVKL